MLADAEPKRTSIFEILKDTARKTFESRKLDFEVYGSMATGLAIDTSDLDISIAGAYTRTSNPIDDRKNLVAALASLHQNLNAIDCIRTNQFISTASIPVIKLLVDFEKLDNFQKSTN
jgi:DNA polymerase sigma